MVKTGKKARYCFSCSNALTQYRHTSGAYVCVSCKKIFLFDSDYTSDDMNEAKKRLSCSVDYTVRPAPDLKAWARGNTTTIANLGIGQPRILVPPSLADLNHFGHVIGKYCEFMTKHSEE